MLSPLLALVLVGAIEVGRYGYFSIAVANAARAGVAYGAQNGATALDTTGMQSAASADGANSVASLTVTASHACYCWNGSKYSATSCTPIPTCTSGHPVIYVTVNTKGVGKSLLNAPFLPSSFTVSSSATMRVVNP